MICTELVFTLMPSRRVHLHILISVSKTEYNVAFARTAALHCFRYAVWGASLRKQFSPLRRRASWYGN